MGVSLGSDDEAARKPSSLGRDTGKKYTVGGVVAQGGMGAILEARDADIRRRVAMKVLREDAQESASHVARFIQEAQVTGQLEHPGIVPVYELGVDRNDRAFYTMKFVRGVTLRDIVRGLSEGDPETADDYSLNRRLNIFLKICEAMAFAHEKRVIHRDLKPENIMVGRHGEVFVMDWGLAKILSGEHGAGSTEREEAGSATQVSMVQSIRSDLQSDSSMTMDGQVMGTPAYMAPEQAEGQVEGLDERTDIYALGGILYALLTFHPPVDGDSTKEILRNVRAGNIVPIARDPATVPAALAAVCMKALSLHPADRYESVAALQHEIEHYQSGFATDAEHAGLGRLLLLFIHRHKAAAISAVVIFAALAVGLSVALVQRARARAAETDARLSEQRAVVERQTAIRAKDEADVARGEAEEARDQAQQARDAERELREKAEYDAYVGRIGLADQKIRDDAYGSAIELLEGCPERFRHWEWTRLRFLCETGELTLRHGNTVMSASFSPDGSRILTASWDSCVRLWDAVDGHLVREWEHSIAVTDAQLSPDGRRYVSVDATGLARIWRVDSDECLAELAGHSRGNFMGGTFSADGTMVATFSNNDPFVIIWNASTGEETRRIPLGLRAKALAFCPGSSRLAVGGDLTVGYGGLCVVLDAVSGTSLTELSFKFAVIAVAFSVDGGQLAVGLSDGTCRVSDASSGEVILSVRHAHNAPWAVGFCPVSNRLATAGRDGVVRVWDLDTGELIQSLVGHSGTVYDVVFAPSGEQLLTAGHDGLVKLWSLKEDGKTLVRQVRERTHAKFSPSGELVVVWPRVPQLLKAADGSVAATLPDAGFPVDFSFSPDGTALFGIGGQDGTFVRRWRIATAERTAQWETEQGRLRSIACADSDRILTWGADQRLVLRNAGDGTELAEIARRVHGGYRAFTAPRLSPDYSTVYYLAAEDEGRSLREYHIESGTARVLLSGWPGGFLFSPDRKQLIVTSDTALTVYDVETLEPIHKVRPQAGYTVDADWSPDGKRILTCGDDGIARLWDAVTSRELLALRGHEGRVNVAEFAPDGKTILTAGQDGKVILWKTE